MMIAAKPSRALGALGGVGLIALAAWPVLGNSGAAGPTPAAPVRLAALPAAALPQREPVDLLIPPPDLPLPGLPAIPDGVDAETLRQAVELYRRGDVAGGDRLRRSFTHPGALALAEWLAIRFSNAVPFERILTFLRQEAEWPASPLILRRAEEALILERKPPQVVRAFFSSRRPVTAAGKLALALAFKADGLDRDAAATIREMWRNDAFGRELEGKILEAFPDLLGQADHRARMEKALLKENWDVASRAAERAGKDYILLYKARLAVEGRGGNAAKALEAVPASLRADSSWIYSRLRLLRKKKQWREAAKLIEDVTRDPDILADGDVWWHERRRVVRELLDLGEAQAAYSVARNHGAVSTEKRLEAEFHAGWIALRFLNEPATAARHFAIAGRIAETPISVARMAYWQGRAAEVLGQADEARAHYARGAERPLAYYGQLAAARLGRSDLPIRPSSHPEADGRLAFAASPCGQAARLLYRIGARDLAGILIAELSQRLDDPARLDALADLAAEQKDARGLLTIGKAAVQRGLPLDRHAFPTLGIPAFDPVGTPVERSMVYAIARQESLFDPTAQSSAGARGLMQLMPATARRTAQHFGIAYDENRLSEASYNARIGSAHLGELMQDWRGSYILTFASYNAGGGNVKKWVDAYGDPRSADVDPVDWVERIPFSETRNYVQRVMENLQVYRNRLGERAALLIEADLHAGRRDRRAVEAAAQ